MVDVPFCNGGSMRSLTPSERRDAFARLFARHDRWLFAYLVTLLGNAADAEEVFQEVCVVVWRHYEQFDLETSFVSWVGAIAYNQVRKFRRESRRGGYQLSDATCDLLASDAENLVDLFDARREALRECLAKLSASDQRLIQRCYEQSEASFKAIADEIGRPANTVYKALARIRRALHACIDRTLTAEGVK